MKPRILLLILAFVSVAHAQNEWVLQPYIEVTGTRALQQLGKNVTGFPGSFPNNPYNVAVSEVGQTGLYSIHSPNDKTPQRIYFGENVVHGDFNGDRYTDFAVWQNRNFYPIDTVIVYFGNAAGVDTTGGVVISSEGEYTYFGRKMCAGDINGDGFDDLVITDPSFGVPEPPGKVYLYMGSPNFDSVPDFSILGEHRLSLLGVRCAVGDLNDDRFADLVIRGDDSSTPNYSFGYLNIYFGGAPFDTTKDLTSIKSPLNGPEHGLSVFDANGDTVADLLWTYHDTLLHDYKIIIHFGGRDFPERFRQGQDFIIPDPDSQRVAVAGFGFDIANAGDMNGDGDNDIIVGTETSGAGDGFVFVFSGGKALNAAFDAAVGQGVDSRFGTSVSGIGDVNGDGLSDIIVGAPDWRFRTRQGYWGIFLGDSRIPTSVQAKNDKPIPKDLRLEQNYPNPFNAGTNIQFSIPQAGWVQMQIFNINGMQVRNLLNAYHQIGSYTVYWDGNDDRNQPCASGIYFSRLSLSVRKGGELQTAVKKLVLTR